MLNIEEKSAEGIVGGAPAEGLNDERRRIMTERDATASDHLPMQAAAIPQDERVAGSSGQPESIHTPGAAGPGFGSGQLAALKQAILDNCHP